MSFTEPLNAVHLKNKTISHYCTASVRKAKKAKLTWLNVVLHLSIVTRSCLGLKCSLHKKHKYCKHIRPDAEKTDENTGQTSHGWTREPSSTE